MGRTQIKLEETFITSRKMRVERKLHRPAPAVSPAPTSNATCIPWTLLTFLGLPVSSFTALFNSSEGGPQVHIRRWK